MQLSLVFNILFSLGNKFGNLFVFVFVLTKVKAFRRLVSKESLNLKDKMILSLIFGIFGIIGTYFSIEYKGALINTRIIGVASGGLFGGPLVGLMSGIVAGIHRGTLDAGNVTSTICAISTMVEGLVAGYFGLLIRNRKIKWPIAMLVGAICEGIRKVALLLFLKPFDVAWDLVADIAIPMIVINSIGLAIFFVVLESTFKEREELAAEQAALSLKIAERALPFLKNGLRSEDLSIVAELIFEMTDFNAVTLTDREKILAHVGSGTVRHQVDAPVLTTLTDYVLSTGLPKVTKKCNENCNKSELCPLRSSLTLPIFDGEQVIGTIKLYKNVEDAISKVDMQLGEGLAKLISTEIRIANLEQKSKLLKTAEIKILQAQINPHFLFNSLTVIGSVVRTEPNKARELILSLSDFFRKNLSISRNSVDIKEEIEHVRSYVTIEMARLKDELEVIYELDENLEFQIPPITLQPIVENAIKHGIYPKNSKGQVKISVQPKDNGVSILIDDNGIGMDKEALNHVNEIVMGKPIDFNDSNDSYGLINVINRLRSHFGENIKIKMISKLNYGTTFSIYIEDLRGA